LTHTSNSRKKQRKKTTQAAKKLLASIKEKEPLGKNFFEKPLHQNTYQLIMETMLETNQKLP